MADRPPLAAVVFDAGGTLVRLDFEWMSEWLAGAGVRVAAHQLARAEVEGRRRYDESCVAPPASGDGTPPLGRAGDTRAYLGGMLAAARVPAALHERAVDAFLERHRGAGLWIRPVAGARAALDRLAARGLRLACVSNSDGRAEWHLEQGGVRAGLEFVVDSERVGIEKPDPRIFHLALDRLGVAPAHAMYVGDIRGVDERGAREAGLHFVLIDPWGDYGAAGGLAVRRIAELPDLIENRFTPRPAAARTPTPAERSPS